jgi:hypothetical protein
MSLPLLFPSGIDFLGRIGQEAEAKTLAHREGRIE